MIIEVVLACLFLAILYERVLDEKRQKMKDYCIIEGVKCALAVAMSDPFMNDVKLIEARNKYIKSTIKLLDHWDGSSKYSSSDQVKGDK